jgi:hypothetical protein
MFTIEAPQAEQQCDGSVAVLPLDPWCLAAAQARFATHRLSVLGRLQGVGEAMLMRRLSACGPQPREPS